MCKYKHRARTSLPVKQWGLDKCWPQQVAFPDLHSAGLKLWGKENKCDKVPRADGMFSLFGVFHCPVKLLEAPTRFC